MIATYYSAAPQMHRVLKITKFASLPGGTPISRKETKDETARETDHK